MKYLGIDYGTKRIGLALSDDGGEFAFPYGIIDSGDPVSEIAQIVTIEGVVGIVLGHSVASNGALNDIAARAQKFKELLSEKVSIPIVMEREDFSSFEAHRFQVEKGHRDDSAAAIILQRYLDKKKKD